VIASVAPSFLRRRVLAGRLRTAAENLRRWDSTGSADIGLHQLRRLRAVWSDAVTHVPYYQRLVAGRAAPPSIESLEQFFADVPPLHRQDIIASPELFVRTDRTPDEYRMTAGSTGNPLRIGVFDEEAGPPASDVLTGRMANGLESGDRIFLLWGHAHLLGTGIRGAGRHAVRQCKDWLVGYHRSDAYKLDPASARAHMDALVGAEPQILLGYSTAVDLLVRHNADRHAEARALGLKCVVVTGEMLPADDSRRVIEHFFGCPLACEYGGVEFGAVAHTVPSSVYRVYWWNMLVEAIDGENPRDGRAAVTALYPRYLPLVRYLHGDELSGVHRLPAGSVVAFDEVKGRHHDAVRFDEGTVVHSMALFHCIHQEPGVYNIQLVLEPAATRILLVSDRHDEALLARIRRRLRSLGPALAEASIELVPDLVTNRAGKRRWIVDRRRESA
jgi:phenylacetate-coenzyme A ligase PaaK-like adenylate-forming protein